MTQKTKSSRLDFLLAVALIVGALVLAAVSFWLPRHFLAPMTADIHGTVEEVDEVYAGTRMAIHIEGNDTSYTMLIEDFEALPEQPEVGDFVDIQYMISSERQINVLKVGTRAGDAEVVYHQENYAAQAVRKWQITAFVVYGVYAVICVLLYRKKSGAK